MYPAAAAASFCYLLTTNRFMSWKNVNVIKYKHTEQHTKKRRRKKERKQQQTNYIATIHKKQICIVKREKKKKQEIRRRNKGGGITQNNERAGIPDNSLCFVCLFVFPPCPVWLLGIFCVYPAQRIEHPNQIGCSHPC